MKGQQTTITNTTTAVVFVSFFDSTILPPTYDSLKILQELYHYNTQETLFGYSVLKTNKIGILNRSLNNYSGS